MNSDIISTAYITRAAHGYETSAFVRPLPGHQACRPGQHPAAAGAHLPRTRALVRHAQTTASAPPALQLSMDASVAGLKRSQPNFVTGGIIERFDLHPQLAYPIHLAQWNFLPSDRRTRDRLLALTHPARREGGPRARERGRYLPLRLRVLLRHSPPGDRRAALSPRHLNRLLGSEFRHTIEPEVPPTASRPASRASRTFCALTPTDIVANTNELEYGVTQHIYRRSRKPQAGRDGACPGAKIAL